MSKGSLLTVVAFLVLLAVAIGGWVRTPPSVAAATPLTPAAFSAAISPADDTSAPQVRRAYRGSAYRSSYVAPHHRRRPFSHSVAIVAGGAGAGAAIGGLAGGGKGAAIGALSGGAAGLIYDRLTHNK